MSSVNKDALSKRAKSARDSTPKSKYYLELYAQEQKNRWSPNNQEGTLLMSIAESVLTRDLLKAKLPSVGEIPAEFFGYGDLLGTDSLKEAFIHLMETTFLQGQKLSPSNLIVGAGASTLFECLFFAILDVGDGVLVPAPLYGGFSHFISFRCQGKLVPAVVDFGADVQKQLSEAKNRSEAEGVPIRAVVITNPTNPMGTILPESSLTSIVEWCANHKIHLIAVEVYANSIFNEEPVPFRSLYDIAKNAEREELNDRMHLIYGISKDFCASGFRVGMIYTESQIVRMRINACTVICGVPMPLQNQLATVFQDTDFVQSFIKENKRRLKESYDLLTNALIKAEIAFVEAQAGMFLWMDLRSVVEIPDFETERLLCQKFQKAGILLTPGEGCFNPIPGFFRVCYATVPASVLPLAVERIKRTLGR